MNKENEILIPGFSDREQVHLASLSTRGVMISIIFWMGMPSPLDPGLIGLQAGILALLVDVSRVGMLAGFISAFWLMGKNAHRHRVMFPVLVIADYFIWVMLGLSVLMAGIGYGGDYFLALPCPVKMMGITVVIYLLLQPPWDAWQLYGRKDSLH